MQTQYAYFVGIDWATEAHEIPILTADRKEKRKATPRDHVLDLQPKAKKCCLPLGESQRPKGPDEPN